MLCGAETQPLCSRPSPCSFIWMQQPEIKCKTVRICQCWTSPPHLFKWTRSQQGYRADTNRACVCVLYDICGQGFGVQTVRIIVLVWCDYSDCGINNNVLKVCPLSGASEISVFGCTETPKQANGCLHEHSERQCIILVKYSKWKYVFS